MYKLESKWSPQKKKAVKVSGKYIGVVTPGGVVPKRGTVPAVKTYHDYEFWATYLLYRISGDLVEVLTRHFGEKSAVEIWIAAALRLATRCPFRAVRIKYEKSWISRQFPNIPLSRSNMTNILRRIRNDRAACAAFMRETMTPAPSMIVDGTRIISWSEGITKAMPGHAHDHCHMPQADKIYVMSSDGGYGYPAFYRNVDGNTPDVSAMVLTMEDAGIRKAIVLGDAGFGSDGDYKELSDPRKELDHIIPLRRNTSEIKAGESNDPYGDEYLKTVRYEDVFTYHGRAIDAHSETKDGYRVLVFRDAKMAAKEKSDFVMRKEKANATARTKKDFTIDKLVDIPRETAKVDWKFGIIPVRTSLLDFTPQRIYETYKIRWQIEELFNIMKNTCEQDTSHIQNNAGFEAWSFITHIMLMMACRVLARIRDSGLEKDWSITVLMSAFTDVRIGLIGNNFVLNETTKKIRDVFSNLGVQLALPDHLST
ncbi:MAG: transposase [Deltaproteobacteria bacterium]|jgi:transposase|nr:transposase [Deltaproteobacteria bacterium]